MTKCAEVTTLSKVNLMPFSVRPSVPLSMVTKANQTKRKAAT
jgi:hypothetical protein